MPPIELGPARPIGAIDVRTVRNAGGEAGRPARAESAVPAVVRSEVFDPGEAPVDVERVELIRKAVESGDYPVIPAQVADAMIAAGLLLRNGK